MIIKKDECRQVKFFALQNRHIFNVRLGRAACIHIVNMQINIHCADFYKFNVLWSILKFHHTFLLLTLSFTKYLEMSTNFLDSPRIVTVLYSIHFLYFANLGGWCLLSWHPPPPIPLDPRMGKVCTEYSLYRIQNSLFLFQSPKLDNYNNECIKTKICI
jgi:hypothetical protein